MIIIGQILLKMLLRKLQMNYKEILQNIINNGTPKQPVRFDSSGNHTPVENGTIGTFCEIFRHDMSQGFPLTTLRKMPFKSTCSELEMFVKGITDKDFLKSRNSNFWNYWCSKKELENFPKTTLSNNQIQEYINDLGPLGYSNEFRNFNGYNEPVQQIYSPYNNDIKYLKSLVNINTKSKHVGKIYKSNYGDFLVINAYSTKDSNRRCYYDVAFLKTGYISKKISSSNISKKTIRDPYYPKQYSVGCVGETAKKTDKLFNVWQNMISRCYNNKYIGHKNYSDSGVKVCNRWLNASVFIEDVQKIPGWKLKQKKWRKYSLDKDLLGNGFLYSPENCCWIDQKTQHRNKSSTIIFQAEHEDYGVIISDCIIDFAKENNLDNSAISKAIKDSSLKVKGWSFKFVKHKKEKQVGSDQLKTVVNNLKNNPYDRRMVVSFWNPNTIHSAALPSCHLLHNIVVYGNKLNLVFFQRSCDFLINQSITTYGLLLLLYCEESGLEPGELVGIFSDCHLYTNQIENAKELLKREERGFPIVTIKRKQDRSFSIFDWKYSDIILDNYNPHDRMDMGSVTV